MGKAPTMGSEEEAGKIPNQHRCEAGKVTVPSVGRGGVTSGHGGGYQLV